MVVTCAISWFSPSTLGDHLRATLGYFERSATVGADALLCNTDVENTPTVTIFPFFGKQVYMALCNCSGGSD